VPAQHPGPRNNKDAIRPLTDSSCTQLWLDCSASLVLDSRCDCCCQQHH